MHGVHGSDSQQSRYSLCMVSMDLTPSRAGTVYEWLPGAPLRMWISPVLGSPPVSASPETFLKGAAHDSLPCSRGSYCPPCLAGPAPGSDVTNQPQARVLNPPPG
ncbi:Hypothetical predicted protein [Pelobates cultripes]|uniref:Uncharacterized protein n=1 Tax=Pelobates cultripes TaxID=61616 RepID=A0AAD1W7L1_PELCU|nr:Hypothetical predicted protein [Pelobates cultripes]